MNFRMLFMTSKLKLKLPKWICSYLTLFKSSLLRQCNWKTKNVYVFQFFDTYLIPLLVSMFSSADNDILYQGKQASHKISWKTQPKLLQKCTHTSVMRPVSKHKRVLQHAGYNRCCHNTSKSLPWIVCRCNAMYKSTNTFNDEPLHLHVMSCCKQAWGRKMKKISNNSWNGFKQWYYREIVTINLSKRGFVFLQIILYVCSLLLEYFKRSCVFLQVYKLAPLFRESIMSRAGYLFSQEQYSKE